MLESIIARQPLPKRKVSSFGNVAKLISEEESQEQEIKKNIRVYNGKKLFKVVIFPRHNKQKCLSLSVTPPLPAKLVAWGQCYKTIPW